MSKLTKIFSTTLFENRFRNFMFQCFVFLAIDFKRLHCLQFPNNIKLLGVFLKQTSSLYAFQPNSKTRKHECAHPWEQCCWWWRSMRPPVTWRRFYALLGDFVTYVLGRWILKHGIWNRNRIYQTSSVPVKVCGNLRRCALRRCHLCQTRTFFCHWRMEKVIIKLNFWHLYHNEQFKHTAHPTYSPITQLLTESVSQFSAKTSSTL